jgi:hypothetical protein
VAIYPAQKSFLAVDQQLVISCEAELANTYAIALLIDQLLAIKHLGF